jgi:hypothetical protein
MTRKLLLSRQGGSEGETNGSSGVVVGGKGTDGNIVFVPPEKAALVGQQPIGEAGGEHTDGRTGGHIVKVVVVTYHP